MEMEAKIQTGENHTNTLFVGMIIIGLFALSRILSIVPLAYLPTVLCLIYAFVGNETGSTFLAFFLIPNTGFCTINGNAICGYYVICVVLRYLINNRVVRINRIAPVIMFLSVTLVSVLLNGNYSSYFGYIKLFFYFAYMYIILAKYSDLICIGTRLYIYGATIGVLFGLVHRLLNNKAILSISRFDRFTGLAGDPNYYSAILALAISLLIIVIVENKNRIALYWVMLIILLLGGFSSLSRGFVVTIIGEFVFFLLYILFSRRNKIFLRFSIISLIIISCALLVRYTNIYSMVLSRFQEDSITTGSGRIDIWNWYLSRLSSDQIRMFFGFGAASLAVNQGLVKYIEHNTFIQCVYETGVLGAVCILGAFLKYYHECKLNISMHSHFSIIKVLPIFSITCSYLFISQLCGENFIIGALLSIALLKYDDLTQSMG